MRREGWGGDTWGLLRALWARDGKRSTRECVGPGGGRLSWERDILRLKAHRVARARLRDGCTPSACCNNSSEGEPRTSESCAALV